MSFCEAAEYPFPQWYPLKPRQLMHSLVPLLFSSASSLTFFLLHLGFPLVIPLCKLEPICLKSWKLAGTLHVFVRVCVCVCLHACLCGKSGKVAGEGEATEFTAALT